MSSPWVIATSGRSFGITAADRAKSFERASRLMYPPASAGEVEPNQRAESEDSKMMQAPSSKGFFTRRIIHLDQSLGYSSFEKRRVDMTEARKLSELREKEAFLKRLCPVTHLREASKNIKHVCGYLADDLDYIRRKLL
eukprot:TRINITY_DN9667_c0_g1_i2.p1 TRINITY_DN9667_c0_g1~~TRINITY_DN9667_c0_g1_i2.p1  ORF type:complete len:139 (+),score=14.02 TRINITY_DN9667_c0_g1_i2:550-966(+)